ncbi:MAG: hypothetical protein AB7I19_06095 [Planctomycetota bacterium]
MRLLAPPTPGLDLSFVQEPGSYSGTCYCASGDCELFEDCFVIVTIIVQSAPVFTDRLDLHLSQGVAGTSSYRVKPAHGFKCVPPPTPGNPVAGTTNAIRFCATGTEEPGDGFPWLGSLSGFPGTDCSPGVEPTWTHHFWVECPSCDDFHSSC